MMQRSLDNLVRLQNDLRDCQEDLCNRQERGGKYLKEQLQAMRSKEQEIFTKARDNGRKLVSMRSYPDRIQVATLALERLMNQTMKPDKIVLRLSSEQFPDGEGGLPMHMTAMKERGIEIARCPGDIKSYKKILPALRKYLEDLILTVDDDLDLAENLYEIYRLLLCSIIGSRVHKMTYDEEEYLQPYRLWETQGECLYRIN